MPSSAISEAPSAIELAIRVIGRPTFCVVAVLAILLALVLVWAELAVGFFGTPFAGH